MSLHLAFLLFHFLAPFVEAHLAISCIGARPRADLAFLALQRAFRLFVPNQGEDQRHGGLWGRLELAMGSHVRKAC